MAAVMRTAASRHLRSPTQSWIRNASFRYEFQWRETTIQRWRSPTLRSFNIVKKHVTCLLTLLANFHLHTSSIHYSPQCVLFLDVTSALFLVNLRRRAWINKEWFNQIILTHCACVNFSIWSAYFMQDSHLRSSKRRRWSLSRLVSVRKYPHVWIVVFTNAAYSCFIVLFPLRISEWQHGLIFSLKFSPVLQVNVWKNIPWHLHQSEELVVFHTHQI